MSEETSKEEANAKLEEGRQKLQEYYKSVSQKIKENIEKVQAPIREQDLVSLSHIFSDEKAVEFSTLKLIKCVDSISLSEHNPVGLNRKSWGDLLYIKLRTLEQTDY